MTDYRTYKLSKREILFISLKFNIFMFILGYLFYRSIVISLFFLPCTLIYLRIKKNELKNKRDIVISLQFCDAMQFISSSMSAGKNLEIAFKDSIKELTVLYGSDEEIIIKEIKLIIKKVSVNISLADALEDFSNRTGNTDIESFKDAVKISRISGGNIREIVKNVYYVLSLKKDVRNNIEAIISEQKLNFRILMIIPFVLTAFMSSVCPQYMEPLYTLKGKIVSSVVLLLIFLHGLLEENK